MTEIVLLTQPACDLCDHAEDILHRLAPEYDLQVRELSFDSSEGRMLANRHLLLFAPGVLVDGAPFSHGRLSERKLRRELSRRMTTP
jgi:hypothetical protein